MKTNKKLVLIIACILLLFAPACSFSVSTANIKDAYMVRETDSEIEKVTSYGQDEIFLCLAELANAPDDTVISAAWYVVEAEGVDPDYLIDEVSITNGSGDIYFDLANDMLWPVGTYRVDLSLNEEFVQSIEFQVQ